MKKFGSLNKLTRFLAYDQNIDNHSERPVWKYFYHILFIGFAARVLVAVLTDVPLHFDEVMQYLEQAHRLVFGYGIIPWEYREGTRSLIVPGFIAGVLHVLNIFGEHSSGFYINIIKTIFCFISLAIPAGMYFFSRSVFSETSARVGLIFGCFWYEFIIFAHKPLTSFLATALFMSAMAISVQKQTAIKSFFTAVLFMMTIAIRIHLSPMVLLIAVIYLINIEKKQRLIFFFGAASVLLFTGLVDYFSWGAWWSSYYQNINYNLFEKVSAGFGTLPFYQYIFWLILSTGSLFYMVFIWSIYKLKRYHQLLIAIIIILVTHSLIGHKEYRFIFVITPLWLIIMSDMIGQVKKIPVVILSISIFLISTTGLSNKLPYQKNVYIAMGHTVHSFFDKRSDLQAYRYFSKKENITGLVDLTNHWSLSGGYYYLHKKVPLYDTSLYKKYLKNKDIKNYASHIMVPEKTKVDSIPGFRKLKVFSSGNNGNIIVWQREKVNKNQHKWKNYIIKR